MREGGQVTDDIHLGVAGDRQVRLYEHSTGPVQRDTEARTERRRRHAGCPERGTCWDEFGSDVHSFGRNSARPSAGADLDPKCTQLVWPRCAAAASINVHASTRWTQNKLAAG